MSGTAPTLPVDLADLENRFVVSETEVMLPSGAVRLLHPRNADDLISEADYVADDRLPYWADIWPSSIALARSLPELTTRPVRALELGCGLGLVTIAALRCGHDVLATDYYQDALRFARRNALVAAGREPTTRLADWRSWPADLGRFDLVLASDVLYEQPYARLVAATIAASLTPTGVAFVADPGRTAFGIFVAECATLGLSVQERLKVPHEDGAIHQVITIHEVAAAAS